jgi:hypothetical protein
VDFLRILRLLAAAAEGQGWASVPKSTSSVPQISVAHDIIAIKNAAGLVAAQFLHGHPLRDACPDHVADGGPPKVVRDAPRTSGGRPGSPPRLVEAAFGDRLTCPVARKAGPGDRPVEEHVLHDHLLLPLKLVGGALFFQELVQRRGSGS